ncbi:metallophosphoesterase [Clostridium estertheticum]|uniref:metallophosphoesterase n=1 Tax=Clostridium estertheticum TaxID=238834 RepID=UPI001CF4972C|nr:metallophosphoesterase [Clostridium estertheticum]MCB2342614.1 metallophosphoesterase [Clostridium estertheticum]
MRLRKSRKKFFIVFLLLVTIITTMIYFDNNVLQVSHYTVKSNKIQTSFNDFKILQLSDLHSKDFGNHNYKLIEKINSENPDIVVMTGDMINTSDTDFEVFINLAEQVSKNHVTYYIVGNHEENLTDDKLKSLTNKLGRIGISVLDNKKVTITKGKDSINLYGLWFNLRYYKDANYYNEKELFFGVGQNKTLLGNLDSNLYNILLTHNPLYFDTYSSWGADLTLAGHIHGGMIRIPFVGGLFSPERRLFPKYDAGKYQINGKELIVNRGLGDGNLLIRIFNRPEISVITLKHKSAQ